MPDVRDVSPNLFLDHFLDELHKMRRLGFGRQVFRLFVGLLALTVFEQSHALQGLIEHPPKGFEPHFLDNFRARLTFGRLFLGCLLLGRLLGFDLRLLAFGGVALFAQLLVGEFSLRIFVKRFAVGVGRCGIEIEIILEIGTLVPFITRTPPITLLFLSV